MDKVTLKISGMACGGCANSVKQALLALDGVLDCEVEFSEAQAIVSFDPARATLAQMTGAVEASGYKVVA